MRASTPFRLARLAPVFFPALVLVLGAWTLGAPPLRAQTESVPPILAGTFAYSGTLESGRATVLAALEPRIAMLPYFVQGLVRSRIEERLGIPRLITVALEAENVSVTYEGERVVTVACALGGTTTVTSREGATIPVTQRLSYGWLEQLFTGENGTLTVLLSTEPDGRTLHADGTMRGERLGEAVPVRLDYVRVP